MTAKENYMKACEFDRQGKELEAIEFYKLALKEVDTLSIEDQKGLYLGMGSTYRWINKLSESEKTIVEAQQLFPDSPEFKVFLALTNLDRDRPHLAVAELIETLLKESHSKSLLQYKRALSEQIAILRDKNNLSPLKGSLHHLDINVRDLKHSMEFWGWILTDLGYTKFNEWPTGVSWRIKDACLHFVQVEEKYLAHRYHRKGVGLNHIAFYAQSREQVSQISEKLKALGTRILYEDRHPFAGGENHFAVFFEDPDRIKVEVAAP